MPLAQKEEADKAIQDMSSQGLIEPSESLWISPIERLLPLPRIEDTLDTLARMNWFSTLDLKSGYWQVEMDPVDKEKTAFTTGRGLWQFKAIGTGLL